jgi:FkbM family methyltransferase
MFLIQAGLRLARSAQYRFARFWRPFVEARLRHWCADRMVLRPTAHGFAMKVNPRFYSDYGIYFWGEYDAEMSAFLLNHCREGMVCVDAGACHGFFSLLMARSVGSEGRVYTFEPLPANFQRVQENLALNGLTNVTVSPTALSDSCGTACFQAPDDRFGLFTDEHHRRRTGNNPGSGFLTGAAGQGTLEVRQETLDDFVRRNQVGRLDLLKIDVEGAELALLRGARCLADFRPVICIELNFGTSARSGYTVGDLYAALEGYGYRMYWFRDRVLRRIRREDLASFRNAGDVYNAYCFPGSGPCG